MTKWGIHALFAVLLLASIATNFSGRAIGAAHNEFSSEDVSTAVLRLAQTHGMVLQTTAKGDGVSALTFRAPGCPDPVLLAPVDINLEQLPLVPQLSGDTYAVRYAYLDRVWDKPDRASLYLQWKFHRALQLIGLSRYLPLPYVLLIQAPPDCRSVQPLDWSPIWQPSYVADSIAYKMPLH